MPRNIVSSSHLVSDKSAELSEFEFGLMVVGNAFNRWMVRCMAAAGMKDLAALDVSLLHHVNHRDRQKKLADICFVLNVEDTHVVAYSLRKLVKLGLVRSQKIGKEAFFSTTSRGQALCEAYRQVREECLMTALGSGGQQNQAIADCAQLMRKLSGLYDQASRSAASL